MEAFSSIGEVIAIDSTKLTKIKLQDLESTSSQ